MEDETKVFKITIFIQFSEIVFKKWLINNLYPVLIV